MVILLALASALANALGAVLQRRGAVETPAEDAFRLRLLIDLARQPATLGGILALIVGVALQAAALSGAAISLIEPILVLELPLTLLLAALIFRGRPGWRTWLAILMTTAGLGGFLAVSQPSGGSVRGVSTAAWIPAVGVSAAVVGALVVAGRRAGGARRAALIGVASGVGHGLSASLIKAVTVVGAGGATAVLASWQLYAVVLAGGGSLFLYQNALQAGPLVAAQPGLNIADPVFSVVWGVTLYGERLRGDSAGLVLEVATMALMAAGLILLAHSPIMALVHGRLHPEAPGAVPQPVREPG